jgi:hypothetical protein
MLGRRPVVRVLVLLQELDELRVVHCGHVCSLLVSVLPLA